MLIQNTNLNRSLVSLGFENEEQNNIIESYLKQILCQFTKCWDFGGSEAYIIHLQNCYFHIIVCLVCGI